jgi:DNA mismatch repair protein MutL
MSDIIRLLPDSVANQIAAGEVIQRPASAVKELMENAIDAGATQIKLIVKDGGKTLIQLVDNGKGMSETDARLCFERHATSKIIQASDLFSIRTMGFRGEALASIAAISRVELKTRTETNQMGTEVIVEASVTLNQQPCQCPVGTSISVKNLFFNTPARRNFLKSEQVEKGHILAEFTRIALSKPGIAFQFYQNNQLTHQLEAGNLKQRIVSLFGNQYLQRLVPVDEKTDIVGIYGYAIKPEYARKRRSEQFFFVNDRYIRSPYLGHAIEHAFQELIPEGSYPSYFIFLETDPAQIDINVHPTKTEIKFQDESLIYQVLKTAVRRALGKFNLTPSLDFERETSFDNAIIDRHKPVVPPVIHVDPTFNPFNKGGSGGRQPGGLTSRVNPQQWETLFPGSVDIPNSPQKPQGQAIISPDWSTEQSTASSNRFIHLHRKYIVASVKSGLMIIDQQRAHERILYERYVRQLDSQKSHAQQLLFPETIILMESDADLFREILPIIGSLGFDIVEGNKSTFVINAIPAEMKENEPLQDILEGIIEQYNLNKLELKNDVKTNTARSMAKRMSLKHGFTLNEDEMISLTEDLFTCEFPYQSPAGKPTISIMTMEEFSEKFK